MIANKTRRRPIHNRQVALESLEARLNLARLDFDLFPISAAEVDGATGVAAADLDLDGDLDVVSVATRGNRIVWHENADGGGAFLGAQPVDLDVDRPTDVFLADVDGDRYPDIIATARGRDLLTWYRNTGEQSFAAQQPIVESNDPLEGAAQAILVDLDGDEDLDVVAATQTRFLTVTNLGDGRFSQARTLARSEFLPSGVAAADFDSDGDLDIAASTSLNNSTFWYENNGSGRFLAKHPITGSGRLTTSTATTDVDKDGDQDVLTASSLTGRIEWHENVDGQFPRTWQLGNFDGISDLSIVDVDGDGDHDIVASSSGVDEVVWFEHDGEQTYSNPRTIQSNVKNVRSIGAADINGDGLQDILMASYAHDLVGWFRQRTPRRQTVGFVFLELVESRLSNDHGNEIAKLAKVQKRERNESHKVLDAPEKLHVSKPFALAASDGIRNQHGVNCSMLVDSVIETLIQELSR